MKVLVIRFSSIGDVTQSLSIPYYIKKFHPDAEIHFLSRSDLAELFINNKSIFRLWTIERKMGLFELIRFYKVINNENFTHLYDAHNNLRSWLARFFISADFKLVRSLERAKRFLLLRFKINLFESPHSGQRDLLQPLQKWNIPFEFPQSLPNENLIPFSEQEVNLLNQKFILPERFICIVPSAAYELKRWPLKNWNQLVIKNQRFTFVVLAGPNDHFTKELNVHANVINWTGLTSLRESAYVISRSSAVIANDTGLMHIAEQMGKPTIALMGPAPFGFPSRKTTTILERNLKCRPCSKHGQGPCVNALYHECLASISADEVTARISSLLDNK
jgi:ADP-heptose:LPS heptosyltransferase